MCYNYTSYNALYLLA